MLGVFDPTSGFNGSYLQAGNFAGSMIALFFKLFQLSSGQLDIIYQVFFLSGQFARTETKRVLTPPNIFQPVGEILFFSIEPIQFGRERTARELRLRQRPLPAFDFLEDFVQLRGDPVRFGAQRSQGERVLVALT